MPPGVQSTAIVIAIVIVAFAWPYYYGKAAINRILGRL